MTLSRAWSLLFVLVLAACQPGAAPLEDPEVAGETLQAQAEDFCRAAERFDLQSTTEAIASGDEAEIRRAVSEVLSDAEALAEEAPSDIQAEARRLADRVAELAAELEQNDFDPSAIDPSALRDPELQSAAQAVTEYAAQRC